MKVDLKPNLKGVYILEKKRKYILILYLDLLFGYNINNSYYQIKENIYKVE
ncbi:unnamed protein product [marine sediment metagenome]|uniref:Uncharacterized protein n=1 Tax=marine sediment metagenome TaxID=412755 RepID=X1FCD9_9ZZZZ